jgi:hypothetical protein
MTDGTLGDALGRERPLVVAAQVLVIVALVLLPLIYVVVPPLQDYPNHLARMQVITALGHDPALAGFYAIEWSLIPNLVMDLIVPPLAHYLGIYAAGRVFIALTFLLLLSGPLAVHRALFGRWSAWPLVGGLFLYNGFLFLGLMNYLFGIGLAVWGLATAIALRDRAVVPRMIVSAAFVLVLYVCHLYAVGVYGLGLLGFEAWRLGAARPLQWKAAFLDAIVVGLPFLPVGVLLLQSPTWGLVNDYTWEAQGKMEGVTRLFSVYSDIADVTVLGLAVLAFGVALRRRLLEIHPAGLVILAIGTIVFLLMPRQLFGSWMADQRLPIAVLFLVIGFVHLEPTATSQRSVKFAIFVALIAVRVVDVSANWLLLSEPLLEVRRAVRAMPAGARLLVANSDEPSGSQAENDALYHAASLATVERSALVSRNFTVEGKQVLRARPPYRDQVDTEDGETPSMSRLLASADGPLPTGPRYWDLWPQRYDYLIVMATEQGGENPSPTRLTLVREGSGFQLYRVRKGG